MRFVAILFVWHGLHPTVWLAFATPEECWRAAQKSTQVATCRIAQLSTPVGSMTSFAPLESERPRRRP